MFALHSPLVLSAFPTKQEKNYKNSFSRESIFRSAGQDFHSIYGTRKSIKTKQTAWL
jgi:hypothetical protein